MNEMSATTALLMFAAMAPLIGVAVVVQRLLDWWWKR